MKDVPGKGFVVSVLLITGKKESFPLVIFPKRRKGAMIVPLKNLLKTIRAASKLLFSLPTNNHRHSQLDWESLRKPPYRKSNRFQIGSTYFKN